MNKKILAKILLPISVVALIGGGIASSLALSSCSNKSKKAEKALEINISHSTNTYDGFELDIEGSYEALNINSPTIEFVDNIPSEFSELHVNYVNKTFTTSLRSNAVVGDYVLQLVANGNVFSNEYRFTVEPFFGASDGSNWSGHKTGTLPMQLNDSNMTAIIGEDESNVINYVAEDLIIPDYVLYDDKIYKVIGINTEAFLNDVNLTGSLTIGRNVVSIGTSAFDGCSGFTGSLTIPNSVTSISGYAFYNCSGFTGSLTIPDSMTSINNCAFDGCSGFDGSLTIPNSVTNIYDDAFYNCSGFTGNLNIPNSVTSIGARAFYGCNGFDGSLTIPNSVTSINNGAFYNCSEFNNISLDGINSQPSWVGLGIFSNWNSGGGTVSVHEGTWPIINAVKYLCDKGLPNSWSAA